MVFRNYFTFKGYKRILFPVRGIMPNENYTLQEDKYMKTLLYSGKIYKDGKEVGSYSFSLFNGTFSWEIEGCQPRHFYKEDELIKELTTNGYLFDKSLRKRGNK